MKDTHQVIEFMVMEKREDGTFKGLGRHAFRLAPRQDEYITFSDDDGIGQVYKVIAVVHPLEITLTAGDLIVKHIDNNINFRKLL